MVVSVRAMKRQGKERRAASDEEIPKRIGGQLRRSRDQRRDQGAVGASRAGGDMAVANVDDLLADFAPFVGLNDSARRNLARHAMTMQVPRHTIIFDQGQSPTAQVVVLEGTVHLSGFTEGRPRMLVEVVTSPDLLLPAAVLEDAPYLLRAQAAIECKLLLVPAEAWRHLVESEPAAALGVISCLTRQFRRMTRQVKNLKLRTTTQRVAAYLLALNDSDSGMEIELPYDKGAIATELGMTRESLSRAFVALETDAIAVNGSKIRIHDRQRLTSYCPIDPLIDG